MRSPSLVWARMTPFYLLYVNTLHVKNTIFALLLPNNILVNGFNVLLVRTYFNNNTPKELIESAMVDGAKEFRIFFSIIMPISKPILATVGLLIGIGYWNDWYNGLLYLTNTKLFSLQNYLNSDPGKLWRAFDPGRIALRAFFSADGAARLAL